MNIIALNSGVKLTEIFSVDEVTSSIELSEELNVQPQPFEISVEIKGNYANIMQFIENLESAAQPIVVSSIEARGQNEDLIIEIQLNGYYQQKLGVEAGKETIR